LWGEEKPQQIQRARALSSLHVRFDERPALQGFTSSALWQNTIARPIPNAGFLFQNTEIWTIWKEKLVYLKKKV